MGYFLAKIKYSSGLLAFFSLEIGGEQALLDLKLGCGGGYANIFFGVFISVKVNYFYFIINV